MSRGACPDAMMMARGAERQAAERSREYSSLAAGDDAASTSSSSEDNAQSGRVPRDVFVNAGASQPCGEPLRKKHPWQPNRSWGSPLLERRPQASSRPPATVPQAECRASSTPGVATSSGPAQGV